MSSNPTKTADLVQRVWFQLADGRDAKLHSVSGVPTPAGGGFTIVCGHGTEYELEQLQFLCLVNKYKQRAPVWLGVGAVPGGEEDPFAVTLSSRPWSPDPELDRRFPVWPLPENNAKNQDS
jgi:hypothetical protein